MQKGGGLTVDEGYAISIDAAGNTYSTGYFTGSASFGTTTLTSSGSTDLFLTKTDNQGNYVWAIKAGGSGSDRGLNIQADAQGNSYVTGYFYGTATFGTQQITSSGNQDVFIAKYDNTGTLLWVVKAGGNGADIGNGITVDNSGNVIVTGEFKGTATFGTTSLTSAGTNSDAFITKLNSSGIFQWTEQGSGPLTIKGIDVASDNQGNIYTTGQFSGNITFDATHTNTMYNAIYLVKYNSSGQEQWYRRIGAGVSNIANAITADGTGNIYLTGDFTGSLTFFGASSNYTLTNTYSKKVFTAKYANSGAFTWAKAAGSQSTLSSKDIAIDGSGNAYIVGHFECKLDEFAAIYGQGTFNSVGYKDIFVCKYSSTGIHQYSKNIGGRQNDYGYGITVSSSGKVHFTGSFNNTLFIPVSSNFSASNLALWNQYACTGNSPYCSDSDYGNYYGLPTSGNLDIAIAGCFDPARQPYDYYLRSGSSCSRPQNSVCIEPNCPDTLLGCALGTIKAYTNTCPDIGPQYKYQWDTNPSDTGASVIINGNGDYYVTVTTEDGCFTSNDSIYVNAHPAPSAPDITDSKGVNTNSTQPLTIELCNPDSVTLTAGGIGTNTYHWTGPGLPASGLSTNNILVTQSGLYRLTVIDSNGCDNSTSVTVTFFPPLDSFLLKIYSQDTFTICEGNSAYVQLYDSISNPTALQLCLTTGVSYAVTTTWTATPFAVVGSGCDTYGYVYATTSGVYNIHAMVIRENLCDADTHYISKDIYIQVNPVPTITPFTVTIVGSEYFCPGDSTLLVGTGAPNYLWLGPGVNGMTDDSIYVSTPGTYTAVSSYADTNIHGCFASHNSHDIVTVNVKPQPSIITNSTLICPNDSIQLTCIGGGTDFHWEGPNGYIPGDTIIYATDPGQYYCIVNDSDSCGLVTNTILLAQYSTPQLLANGDLYICDGDSVQISVISNDSSVIEWQTPLSGGGLTQTVYTPGTYTCKITSCGIVTYASIDVLPANPTAEITWNKLLCKNDSIILSGNPGMSQYHWSPGGDTTASITIYGPGTYLLTTTDSNGCEAISDSTIISVVEVSSTIASTDDSVICFGDSLTLTGPSGYDQYQWTPGNDTGVSQTVFLPGIYYLTVIDTNGCKDTSAPFQVFMPDTITDVNIIGDLHFCENDSVVLKAKDSKMINYTWSPLNFKGPKYVVYTTGTYRLTTIDSFGCVAKADSIQVIMDSNDLITPITKDTLICAHLEITLEAATPIGTINWFDTIGGNLLQTGETYFIDDPILSKTYFVKSVRSVCSSGYAPVQLNVQDCDNLNAPNVFTPNGDGINDEFKFHINGASCFHFKIYNRWGILIFESDNMDIGWNGRVRQSGEMAVDGTYYYIVEYCKYDGDYGTKTGYITLLKEAR